MKILSAFLPNHLLLTSYKDWLWDIITVHFRPVRLLHTREFVKYQQVTVYLIGGRDTSVQNPCMPVIKAVFI